MFGELLEITSKLSKSPKPFSKGPISESGEKLERNRQGKKGEIKIFVV